MKAINFLLCMIFAMIVITGETGTVFAQPDMVQATDSEQDAGSVKFEQVVEFDQNVHFLNQDGTDVVLPAWGKFCGFRLEWFTIEIG